MLGCQRFEAIDIRQLCEAFDNAITVLSPAEGGVFEFQAALGSAIDQVVAKIGETPWQKPSKQTINVYGSQQGSGTPDFAAPERITFDLRTLKREHASESFDCGTSDVDLRLLSGE